MESSPILADCSCGIRRFKLFSSICKKIKSLKNRMSHSEDVYGVVDPIPLFRPVERCINYVCPEEFKSRIDFRHRYRQEHGGDIIIDELVPDNILNNLITLANTKTRETLIDYPLIHIMDEYFSKDTRNTSHGDLRHLYFVCHESHNICGIPIAILLDYITVNKRLHVREREMREFLEGFDIYLNYIKNIEYCSRFSWTRIRYSEYHINVTIPIPSEDINEMIRFLYEIIDKNGIEYTRRCNDCIDHLNYW